MDIRIPSDFEELHLALCMRVVCHVRGLGPSHTTKQNVFSLILLILLVNLMNQKRGIYRHLILYPLRLGPPFPNDAEILRLKVGLGIIRLQIDLRGVTMKNIIFYEQINLFLETKGHRNPRHAYAYMRLCTQV